jgi:glyoxylase-like metal-dependent hydrolase (beta-lactamase superfamily II)
MTFDGTNSWVLAEPGADAVVVVDPGPEHDGHRDRLLAAARGRPVAAILLTHGHGDHAGGARALAARCGAPVLAAGAGLADGQAHTIAGLRIEVLATPGHSADSLSFVLPADGAVLTGDTVLGRGTPAILEPGGSVAHMIGSLTAVRRAASAPGAVLLPGHGPVVRDPLARIDAALAARHARIRSVAAARSEVGDDPAALVAVLYPRLDPALRRVAESTTRAHLTYLDTRAPT